MKADREALEGTRVEMEAQQAEAAELADQMAAEIEQLRAPGVPSTRGPSSAAVN